MTERKSDYRYRILSFMKEDGMRMSGKIYYPEEPGNKQERYPAVIFSHGLGVCYHELEHYGPWFAERGLACLFFDFCGGGSPDSESDGSSTLMSVKTEEEDLRVVLGDLKRIAVNGQLPVDPQKIFLMGESQGGYVSTLLATEEPGCCAGLILWYAAFCLQDMATEWKEKEKNHYTRFLWTVPLGRRYTEDAWKIPIYDVIASCKTPALLVHGDMDNIVPIAYSLRAKENFPQAQMVTIAGGAHGFEGEQRWLAAQASLDFVLQTGI